MKNEQKFRTSICIQMRQDYNTEIGIYSRKKHKKPRNETYYNIVKRPLRQLWPEIPESMIACFMYIEDCLAAYHPPKSGGVVL